jgi:hypothetical protein
MFASIFKLISSDPCCGCANSELDSLGHYIISENVLVADINLLSDLPHFNGIKTFIPGRKLRNL